MTLDPATASSIIKGPLFVGPFRGLAVHPRTRELYATKPVDGGTEIRRISASDGTSRHVTTTLAEGLYGLAFASGEVVYAVAQPAAGDGRLCKIDLSTGDTALVRTYSAATFHGLAWNTPGSHLWASGRTLRGNDCIYRIDPSTGDTSFVGSTGDGRITSSLCFSKGRLLGTQTIGASTSIVSIDTSTGQGTIIGSTGVAGITAIAGDDRNTGVGTACDTPQQLSLSQSYPNPFNACTIIEFALPKSTDVRLSVYDMLGREVTVLVNERRNAGLHKAVFDGSELSSGVYFYRLKTGDFTKTKRMISLK
jgi:hypothetical protein